MPGAVVPDRVHGDPITAIELAVVIFKGAKDHRVAGPGGQQSSTFFRTWSFRHTRHRGSRWNLSIRGADTIEAAVSRPC